MLRYNLIPTFKEINLSKYMKVWSPPSECDYIDCIEAERERQEDADICANCNCMMIIRIILLLHIIRII